MRKGIIALVGSFALMATLIALPTAGAAFTPPTAGPGFASEESSATERSGRFWLTPRSTSHKRSSSMIRTEATAAEPVSQYGRRQ